MAKVILRSAILLFEYNKIALWREWRYGGILWCGG